MISTSRPSSPLLLSALSSLALLPPARLAAQTTVAVPAHAPAADGHESVSLPFGRAGFRTQILIDAAAIAPNGAVLSGLRFRADRASTPLAAVIVPNVTVTLSETNVAVGAMGTAFAANIGTAPLTVFTGSVTLPAQTSAAGGPQGFAIDIQFSQPFAYTAAQGNLLLDLVGSNAANAAPTYWLDAVRGGGSATVYGEAGDNPSFDHLGILVATGNTLEPRLLSPGNTVDFISTLTFTSPPGFLGLAFDAFANPIDLGPLGAPTHSAYLSPLALAPLSWQQSFIGFYAITPVAIPAAASFTGLVLYGQPMLLEPTANALGVLTGPAAEVRIGDATTPLPMQQLDAADPAAVAGTILAFGNTAIDLGAAPLQLEGVFF